VDDFTCDPDRGGFVAEVGRLRETTRNQTGASFREGRWFAIWRRSDRLSGNSAIGCATASGGSRRSQSGTSAEAATSARAAPSIVRSIAQAGSNPRRGAARRARTEGSGSSRRGLPGARVAQPESAPPLVLRAVSLDLTVQKIRARGAPNPSAREGRAHERRRRTRRLNGVAWWLP
jgi:hypothetical protein